MERIHPAHHSPASPRLFLISRNTQGPSQAGKGARDHGISGKPPRQAGMEAPGQGTRSEGSGVMETRIEDRGHTRLRGCSSEGAACPRTGIIWVPRGEERDDKVTESPREKPPME